MKISDAQIEASCRIASAVYAGKMKTAQGVNELVNDYQVSPATANDFIRDYNRLVQGKVFQRAMSAAAMRYYIEQIAIEHGSAGMANAVESLWAHIYYYEALPRPTMHTMRAVAAEFEAKLTSVAKPPHLTDVNADLADRVAKSLADSAQVRNQRLAKASRTPKRIEVSTYVYVRNADVVAAVLERASEHCERCKAKAPFLRASNGSPYLEVHHRKQLADDGDDSTDNAMAICPNCHRELHYGQKPSSP